MKNPIAIIVLMALILAIQATGDDAEGNFHAFSVSQSHSGRSRSHLTRPKGQTLRSKPPQNEGEKDKEKRWIANRRRKRPHPPSVISPEKAYMLHILEQQSLGVAATTTTTSTHSPPAVASLNADLDHRMQMQGSPFKRRKKRPTSFTTKLPLVVEYRPPFSPSLPIPHLTTTSTAEPEVTEHYGRNEGLAIYISGDRHAKIVVQSNGKRL